MRDIRAVVTDLDGTVLDHEKRVSAATVRAAADLAARGIPLIIATARTPTWVAALEPLVPLVSVAVCCGGAVGWSPKAGKMLWRDTIPPDGVDRIVRFTVQHLPNAGIAAYDGQQWRVTEAFATLGPTRRGLVEIVAAEQIAEHPVCAMSLCHPGGSRDELLRALVADAQLPPNMEFSVGNVVDIAPSGIDKAVGITRALAEVGVDSAHAIAFGDMPNDLPMFALCGYTVAVANAHPDVIAAATGLAACIHDDGFARTLGDLDLVGIYRADEARSGPGCSCPPVEGVSRQTGALS
ncbi:MAG: HAD-IIB family hydrolase [Pseudonocardiaceae bacterium]